MIIEALGIEVGDKVWQMIGTYQGTPYRVESIHGPYFWATGNIAVIVWPYPVVSLTLKSWNYPKDYQRYGINDIHKDGDRWFTDQGDEVFVEKPKNRKILQIDLFSFSKSKNIYSDAYKFSPDVDYSDPNKVFKCKKCSLDFNGEMSSWTTPYCPVCGVNAGVSDKIIVMERVKPGKKYFSSYQRALGAFGYPMGEIE